MDPSLRESLTNAGVNDSVISILEDDEVHVHAISLKTKLISDVKSLSVHTIGNGAHIRPFIARMPEYGHIFNFAIQFTHIQ